jgi:hypothetical protein
MAEHQIVDLAVEGSNPSSHPNLSIHFVYTEWVDDRPIVWDAANRKHLGSDHPERHISIMEKRHFMMPIASRPSLSIARRVR